MENYTETPVSNQITGNYAGFWRRFAAFIIDALILAIPSYFLATWFGHDPSDKMHHDTQEVEIQYFTVYNAVSLLVNWLYFALQESSARQATIGKQALGIYVTDTEGGRLSFMKATLRYFGKILSGLTFGVGYIMAAFTARRQALHDFIANTLVWHR